MLLRIFLVIAILAGAGVIAISHFQVRPQIESIIGEREKNAKDRDTEKAAKMKAQTQLKDTTAKLKDTEQKLGETQTQLAASKQQTEAEQKRANGLKQDLERMRLDLNETQQKLARWDGIGLDPSEVKTLISSNKNLLSLSQGLDEEKKFFAKKLAEAQARIADLVGPTEDPYMPPDVKGSVLIVDPKWNFVLLDVGEKQGVVQKGVFMVSRNGKLVAKVRVFNLLPGDRSIANIMPGWKLAEVMEGDRVIH